MMKRKILLLLLIFGYAILLCSEDCFAKILFQEEYYQTLHKYLTEAEDSITAAIYFIIINPTDETNPVNQLVADLIAAKKRGVEVKVILEDQKLKENKLSYQKLKENQVKVYFDTPDHLLHLKGVAIDNRYILVGSANWSKAAILNNYEATLFNDSPEEAMAFKQYVDHIPLQEQDPFITRITGIPIRTDFLTAPESGRILIKAQADKQFDLYLLLGKMQNESGKSSFKIDFDLLAKEMGYQVPQELGQYRNAHQYFYEKIHRALIRLRRYGFIDYKKGVVNMKANKISEAGKQTIIIPLEYWQYGYPVRLSTRAKYMYLVCLYEASRSSRYPSWFRGQKDMVELYGISETTISLGLLELEEQGIIAVTRDKKTGPDFSRRKANVYQMLPLRE